MTSKTIEELQTENKKLKEDLVHIANLLYNGFTGGFPDSFTGKIAENYRVRMKLCRELALKAADAKPGTFGSYVVPWEYP